MHLAQAINYLEAYDLEVGLLINFGAKSLEFKRLRNKKFKQKIKVQTMNNNQQNIIIYKTADGRASVALYAKDGNIWMNQNQLAELFAT